VSTSLRLASFLCLGFLWITPSLAQVVDTSRHDTSLPIAISADSMEVEQSAQRAIFVGAVDVKQGEMTLTSDRLIVYYRDKQAEEDNTIYLIEVEGNVEFRTPNETAQGDTGEYDVDTGIIRLLGNVILTSGDNLIKGKEAVMNLETGQSEVTGGRVEGIFFPEQSDSP
jgi:lipopolysaccharide export system protein LptA